MAKLRAAFARYKQLRVGDALDPTVESGAIPSPPDAAPLAPVAPPVQF